jgi:hypothetical protein
VYGVLFSKTTLKKNYKCSKITLYKNFSIEIAKNFEQKEAVAPLTSA